MPTPSDLLKAQSKEEVIALVEATTAESGIELTPEVKELCKEHADKIESLVKAFYRI